MTKTNSKKIIVTMLSAILFLSAISVLAIDYVPLQPSAFSNIPTPTSNAGLGQYLGAVFDFGIAAAVTLAFIMIVWGGIIKMTTDSWQGQDDAKSKIENALLGLGLALISWLLLFTINPAFVDFKNNLFLNPPSPATNSNNNSALNPLVSVVSTKGCYTRAAGCTDTVDLPANAIAGINNLASIAGSSNVVVTGGAEDGHQTHGVGIPNVDLRYNQAVVNGLTSMGISESPDVAHSGTFICESDEVTKVDCSSCGTDSGCHIHVSFK